MKQLKILASTTILALMIGTAGLAPAAAAPAPATQLQLLLGDQSVKVEAVHCRRYLHNHRRCTLWLNGVCRRWVRYTHRCG